MAHTSSTSGTSEAASSGRGTRSAAGRTHRAGAFDMRNFIAALIGIYGVVLTIYGIIGSSDAQAAKADGLNINLYAGIGMIVVAAFFAIWARLRPVIVPDEVPGDEGRPPSH